MSYITYEVRVYGNGDRHWYQDGNRHRTDGPSCEEADGTKWWYQNGKLHRTDGPAIEGTDGYKAWYQNGLLHRTDGPAIEFANGFKAWCLEGIELTEAEFNVKSKPSWDFELEGKKYKLTEVL